MKETGFARSWVHDKTVVLGVQDSRLPHIADGIRFLKEKGYDVIIRNSGGLAVALDPGIYNLSLVFPEDRSLSIDDGYNSMVTFIRRMFPELQFRIEDGEITESYCPGRFDLSVGGQKFAGISQRRIRGGIAVQTYLAIHGKGAARAELIRSFYREAVQDGTVNIDYPRIEPEKMASLEEIMHRPLNMNDINKRAWRELAKTGGNIQNFELDIEYYPLYEDHLARIRKRNQKLSLD